MVLTVYVKFIALLIYCSPPSYTYFDNFDCVATPGYSRTSLAKSTKQNVGNFIQTTEKIKIRAMS